MCSTEQTSLNIPAPATIVAHYHMYLLVDTTKLSARPVGSSGADFLLSIDGRKFACSFEQLEEALQAYKLPV